MKFFLDTADVDQIRAWAATGLIDGITTNPTHVSKQAGDVKKNIKQICQIMSGCDVSVEVTEHEPDAVLKQALRIADIAENVVVKIPCHRNYYAVIKDLMHKGIKINVTLVFTLPQALYMCKLGVRYISPFIGRWDDIDVDGSSFLFQMRAMIDHYGFDTQLLAASLRTVRHLTHAIEAGADIATVPVELLEKSTNHVLTDQGMEKFLNDWKKLGLKQFP